MAETNTTTSTAIEPNTQQQTQVTDTQTQQIDPKNQDTNQQKATPDGEKKYSDADINKIINQKFAEWQKKKDAEIDEAKKLAEMNEAQKANYEKEKLENQLKELMAKNTLAEMTKTARNILADDGISVGDDLLAVLVSTDAEATNKAVESFKTLFKGTVDKAVKEALKGNPPKAGAKKSGTMTREQIMNVKDPAERQQMIMQNKELFGL